MFKPSLGIGVSIFCVDTLHTLSLGVKKSCVAHAAWALLRSNAFSRPGPFTTAERDQLGAQRMRDRLWAWYRDNAITTRVSDLNLAMLGSAKKPHLHAKGAETEHLASFMVALLAEHQAVVPHGPELLGAGEALQAFKECMAREGAEVSIKGYQELRVLS